MKLKAYEYGSPKTILTDSLEIDSQVLQIKTQGVSNRAWVDGQQPGWADQYHTVRLEPTSDIVEMLAWWRSNRHNTLTYSEISSLRDIIGAWHNNQLDLTNPAIQKAFDNLRLVVKLATETPPLNSGSI